ncbi:OLC1v1033301C1 [Oldenlandia corymbosa var. corymbosa]|uniref:OLC1v1033301C1 n=1 Tax=Oldenlandia corymbosa var. corymbosa TaxID=529605 RepID=A0AAV1CQM9_OLDCO|nr:OLC1v1033301C1 [Oldenlandia corymbosa var. corymbosa]
MDMEENSYFSELGRDDPFVITEDQQYSITDYFDNEELSAFGVEESFFHNNCLPQDHIMIPRNSSTTSLLSASSTVETLPQNAMETPSQNHKKTPSPMLLTFGDSNSTSTTTTTAPGENINIIGAMNYNNNNMEDDNIISVSDHTKKKPTAPRRIRPPSQNYDHIIAERKRREQLSQQFVALSSIVPGLKKTDKTSVLGDTINYLKHLKEREKALEEQAMAQTMESMVLVKQSKVVIDEDDDDHHSNNDGDQVVVGSSSNIIEQPLPEIEAKFRDKHVLLRILCEKQKGVLSKILYELEKFNLAVTSTNVAPFGSLALDITIITEMRKDFNLSTKELVQLLGSALGRRPNK